jgi:hypothetical protein
MIRNPPTFGLAIRNPRPICPEKNIPSSAWLCSINTYIRAVMRQSVTLRIGCPVRGSQPVIVGGRSGNGDKREFEIDRRRAIC